MRAFPREVAWPISSACGALRARVSRWAPGWHTLRHGTRLGHETPHSGSAAVDIRKLRDYVLSPDHRRGRHKARVFAATLGLTVEHADRLRSALLAAAREGDAVAGDRDEFGQRFVLDFVMTGPNGTATVRSSWIVRRGEDFPRLASCFVL
jgi:hypothetical protein